MKRYLQIQMIFLPTILHWAFWIFVSTWISHVGLYYVLTLTSEPIKAMKLVGMAFLSFAFSAAMFLENKLVKENTTWLMLSPMHKNRLPIHLAALRCLCLMAILLAAISGIALASLVTGNGTLTFFPMRLMRILAHFLRHPPSEILGWLQAIFLFNLMTSVLLSGPSKSFLASLWKEISKLLNRSKKHGLGFILFVTAVPLLAIRYDAAFIVVLTIFCILPLQLPFEWREGLGFSNSAYRRAVFFTVALSILQFTVFAGKAITMFHGTPRQQAETIHFLGGWAPLLSKQALTTILENKLDQEVAKTVSKQYAHYFNGERLDRRVVGALDFVKAINSQTNPETILSIYRLYDPASLNLEDLKILLAAFNSVSHTPDSLAIAVQLKDIALSEDEMSDIFVTGSLSELKFALIRARYDRRARYAIDILDHLHEWPSQISRHGIDTVSIILGRRVSMEDWYRYRKGEKIDLQMASVECKNTNKDIAAENVCRRKEASNLFRQIALENEGWIGEPQVLEAGLVPRPRP